MMINIEQMIRYDRWANLACVTALKHADLANQKAVGILGHIVGINEMSLTRAEGANPTLGAWPSVTLAAAEDWTIRLCARWISVMERTPKDLNLTYCDSRGQQRANSLTELVQEVVLHAAHHRGQIALLLRIDGHEPPASTDFIPGLRSNLF